MNIEHIVTFLDLAGDAGMLAGFAQAGAEVDEERATSGEREGSDYRCVAATASGGATPFASRPFFAGTNLVVPLLNAVEVYSTGPLTLIAAIPTPANGGGALYEVGTNGTGAFAAWEADRAGPNGALILRDNDFAFAKGCGDRPVVSIGGCRKVLVLGENRFASGGEQPALSLDPVNLQGRPVSTPNGKSYVAPATKLEGKLLLRGKEPDAEQLARLRELGGSEPEGGSGGGAGGGR